jgi:hypothetical protein
MNVEAYQAFTEALVRNLSADPRVEGLIAVGSMAARDVLPDRWSDHDFFLVVEPGHLEWFRTAVEWLPDPGEILFSYRETVHGVKVLYRDGHLLEFAVFDEDELALAKVNRYRILIDRDGLSERIVALQNETGRWATENQPSDVAFLGNFLTNLVVGVARYRRGEQISGRQFIHCHALSHLLRLLVRHTPAPDVSHLDDLDPFRRFEFVYPAIGRELSAALDLPVPQSAVGLLEIAFARLEPLFSELPAELGSVVRRSISER